VDDALSKRDSSRASYAAAQAELVAARDDLKHCRIVAPISGTIGTTSLTEGNYVTTASGTLVTLVQNNPIRVRFSISNREFLDMFGGTTQALKKDGVVKLTLADGREYGEPGEIEYTENAADERTDTMLIYALFKNEAFMLKPGGSVTVSLTSKRGVMRPALSPTAILQDIEGPYVWMVGEDGAAVRRTVARGDLKGDWLIVEKGLKPGDRVVKEGAQKVRKGMKIIPAK
jgi:membrane fusion protein (multidrug efflux system)